MNYQDFQILVNQNNNIRASSQQGEVSSQLRWEKNQIELSLQLIDSGQTNSKLLKALGSQFYRAIFPDKINARFQATIAAAQKNNESVRLRLVFESPEIVYNQVYQQVFNQSWVEAQLKNLRPYSENFRFWVASGGKDESRLLQGNALESAEKWAKGKDLSFQDKQFLAASKEKEIAVRNQEAELERERKDREAAEKINLELSEANRKAKRRIRNGTVVLGLAFLAAVTLGGLAVNQGKKALEVQKNVETVQALSKLAGELRNENLTAESDEALRQAGLSFRVNDHNLKQAMLLASISQAYQNLVNKQEYEIKEQKDKKLEYQKLRDFFFLLPSDF